MCLLVWKLKRTYKGGGHTYFVDVRPRCKALAFRVGPALYAYCAAQQPIIAGLKISRFRPVVF
jgi:hypothetical protein